MKNDKILILVLLMSVFSACSVKSTNSKRKSATTTSTSGTSTVDSSTDGTTDTTSPTSTYFTIPNIIASGGTYGQTWWSSTSYVAQTGRDENEFTTDKIFNVRIIARSPGNTTGQKSTFNRDCSSWMLNSTKVQAQIMLHTSGVGETATLDSAIGVPSKVWRFSVPKSSSPLVLEVVNVKSDSACSGKYGSVPTGCTFLPIPINNGDTTPPTECVAFDIQYSTDWTTDLPGVRAN